LLHTVRPMLLMQLLVPAYVVPTGPASSTNGFRCDAVTMRKGSPSQKSNYQPFKASSHSKYRNQWRETFRASYRDAPTLQTSSLPNGNGVNRLTGRYPALVLNADYTPLSYVPLSLWSWQDSIRAIIRDSAVVISCYDGVSVRSPSMTIPLPSVIVLKNYVSPHKRCRRSPVFTRRNLFLRDKFCCKYCRRTLLPKELTYDHVVPRAKNGDTSWTNVVTACSKCNVRKGSRSIKDLPADMLNGPIDPHVPTWAELQRNARLFPPVMMHKDWAMFLGDSDSGTSSDVVSNHDPKVAGDEYDAGAYKTGEDWGI